MLPAGAAVRPARREVAGDAGDPAPGQPLAAGEDRPNVGRVLPAEYPGIYPIIDPWRG